MKAIKLIIGIILAVSITTNISAELKPKKVIRTEIKTKKNTYIVSDWERTSVFRVYNKKNYLEDIDPLYLLKGVKPEEVHVGNKAEMERLITKYLTPYFKKYKGSFSEYATLRIHCYADVSGKLKEMVMYYPKELGILPAKAIEQFEEALLNSGVYLYYDKGDPLIKKSEWIRQYVIYTGAQVREMK